MSRAADTVSTLEISAPVLRSRNPSQSRALRWLAASTSACVSSGQSVTMKVFTVSVSPQSTGDGRTHSAGVEPDDVVRLRAGPCPRSRRTYSVRSRPEPPGPPGLISSEPLALPVAASLLILSVHGFARWVVPIERHLHGRRTASSPHVAHVRRLRVDVDAASGGRHRRSRRRRDLRVVRRAGGQRRAALRPRRRRA